MQRIEDLTAGFRAARMLGDDGLHDHFQARAADSKSPPEIRRFATSLKSDEAAIKAALKYRWSKGPVEGQINRLKTLKLQMYCRAHFDLLRK